MLKVLEGIAEPMFDPVENRKKLERAHQILSDNVDKIDAKDQVYRKSDNALLDQNALGPVYCKILRARREKQEK